VEVSRGDLDHVEIHAENYSIEEFTARAAFNSQSTPAASLFASVIAKTGSTLAPDADDRFNPIAANVRSLGAEAVRNGVLSILRAAEIAGSQRMTYREIWGAIARCVVANATDRVNANNIGSFIESLNPANCGSMQFFRKMQRLGDLRFSQALYGAGFHDSGIGDDSRNPVTQVTTRIDPVRDAVPGHFDGSVETGWATPVHDAFSGHVDSGSPLNELLNGLSSDDPFKAAVTNFDRELDRAYVSVSKVDGLRDAERADIISWYGNYLLRLYASSNGIPAFRREIATWTLAWYMSPTLPGDLSQQLRTLLKPERFPEKANPVSLIPVFESRTDPIVGEVGEPKIALKAGSIELRTQTRSDSLFLVLEESGRAIAPIVLDFPLMREALACGAQHSGITEVSDATSPRLERFRAARLVPGHKLDADNYRLVVGVIDTPINVGGRQ
jgi:hypothetical protein